MDQPGAAADVLQNYIDDNCVEKQLESLTSGQYIREVLWARVTEGSFRRRSARSEDTEAERVSGVCDSQFTIARRDPVAACSHNI